MQFLLLEDNDDDARLLRLALTEAAGNAVEICHARRVSEALEQLASRPFDVVLMDLGLPDCQGLETYRAIARRAPKLAVVVMSGLLDEELATRAVQLGAQDYLVKGGSSPESLFKSLRYAVERARRQKAEQELHAAQEEVRIARKIQQRLLPQHPPQLPGLDIACATRFAGKLGGDYVRLCSDAGRPAGSRNRRRQRARPARRAFDCPSQSDDQSLLVFGS
jgi:DNA-binding NarL/FixJ family response regulator